MAQRGRLSGLHGIARGGRGEEARGEAGWQAGMVADGIAGCKMSAQNSWEASIRLS